MAEEHTLTETLDHFYKWLAVHGYIDEEVRESSPTGRLAVKGFIDSWPEEAIHLAGTNRALALEREAAADNPDHASLKNITDENRTNASPHPQVVESYEVYPEPDLMLQRAHENMDIYTSDDSFKPRENMRAAILAENFALLAIAGYLKELCDDD